MRGTLHRRSGGRCSARERRHHQHVNAAVTKYPKRRVERARKHIPRGYVYTDVARDKRQADSLKASYRGVYSRPVVVKTGPARGKGRHEYPYHIAVKRREHEKGGMGR